MQGFLSKERIVLFCLLLLLLGLISFTFFRFKLTESGLVSAKEFYSDVQRSLSPSQAIVSLDKNDLKIRFKIIDADQGSFQSFLNNLRLDNPGDSEIDIKLGDSSAEYFRKLLNDNNLESTKPIKLNLKILSKEVDFDNKKVFGPFDSPAANLLESPSATGSFKTKQLGETGYLIEIDNPEDFLSEGTLSGKLKLSDKLQGSSWWQVLTKVAKINLKIDNGNITGSIYLK